MESSEEEGEILPRITKATKRVDLVKSMDVSAKKKSNSMAADNENVYIGDSEEENEEDIFDTMCAICDDGGDILACDGRCLRSFHATKGTGISSSCKTLGFINDAQVEAIPRFFCDNCKYNMHQCFACGELGSSDRASGAEVFPCISATCGHFYHPKCVSKLIHHGDESQAQKLQEKIAAGESFTCPVHKCLICRQGEDKEIHELQFAVCRRCPKAYHRKCLPPSISFMSDESLNIIQRAWEGYLPKRILIYCRDHTIDRRLKTPARNHIRFPDGGLKMKGLLTNKVSVDDLKRSATSENKAKDKAVVKMPKSGYDFWRKGRIGVVRESLKIGAIKKANSVGAVKKSLMTSKSSSEKVGKVIVNRSSREDIVPSSKSGPHLGNKRQKIVVSSISDKTGMAKERKSASSAMEDRILAFMEQTSSEFNAERLAGRQSISSLYTPGSKFNLDKTITLSKVEGFLKAIQTALQKLDKGCAVEEAKEICEPGILRQMPIWKKKLKVYLGPFIHGPRYTSFGRHFTKVEKLQEIVDRLHWYVQKGDTIVDFCCGSNDFSCLMKEKLDKVGKRCFFKNYDLFPPKNTFQFEKRDWMSVNVDELPDGSQLIMGLNPPFGVNASLANKFINKALTFKPKLLILIVPRETKRLDIGADPYDLLWEDCELLSGKSFYLPGSIDVHNKRLEDWNIMCPPLYLWSCRDWTPKHKTIAEERGHISKREYIRQEETNAGAAISNYLMEENYDCYQDYSSTVNANIDLSSIFDDFPDDDAAEGASNSPLIANFKSTLQHESLRAFGTPMAQPQGGFWNFQPNGYGHVPMQPEHRRTFEVPGRQPQLSHWNQQPNSHGSLHLGGIALPNQQWQHSLWNQQPNSHGSLHLGGITLLNQQSGSQPFGHGPPSSSEYPLQFPFR